MVKRIRPLLFVFGLAIPAGAHAADKKLDFNRDVRPILADKCFNCHGPDTKKVKGGLRLDLAELATQKNDEGRAAIVPGRPKESELVQRIHAPMNSSKLMPPVSSKKSSRRSKKRCSRTGSHKEPSTGRTGRSCRLRRRRRLR